MQDWLSARAQATPHKTAFIFHSSKDDVDPISFLFGQLNKSVQRRVNGWRAAGIKAGDHIAVLGTNSPGFIINVFASLRAGCVLVPLNSRLTVEEMHQQITQSDCKWLLPLPGAYTDSKKALAEMGVSIPYFGHMTDDSGKVEQLDLDAPALIVHTSGTSGMPKGAMLTAGNIFYSAVASSYRLGVLPDDKWLCTLPLYHVGGLSIILRSCLYGITVDLHERFDLETVNTALSEDDITLVSLVPTMLYRLLEQGTPEKWTALRCVLLGGAAATVELLEKWAEYGVKVAPTYGLSEAASQVATALPENAAAKPGTVGHSLMFTQLQIVNDYAKPLPAGEYGEVIVTGPTIMQGYYNNPDATAQTLRDYDGQLWLHTGDIGYMDEDGDLFLVQRRSDLIVTGGENVYPAEVEKVLRSHPAVREVVVVGISDAEWGQRVAAVVEVMPGHTLSADDLITYSREHLAGYKQPRRVLFVDALPQTGSGKIQRRAVVDLFKGQS